MQKVRRAVWPVSVAESRYVEMLSLPARMLKSVVGVMMLTEKLAGAAAEVVSRRDGEREECEG